MDTFYGRRRVMMVTIVFYWLFLTVFEVILGHRAILWAGGRGALITIGVQGVVLGAMIETLYPRWWHISFCIWFLAVHAISAAVTYWWPQIQKGWEKTQDQWDKVRGFIGWDED